MPIDKNPGESKEDFISRCVSKEIEAGKEQDQAYAICITKYEEYGKTQSVTDNTWSTEAPISIELDSYTDYPESAKNSAQRALDWAEKNGWGSCGTPVGKARANQLAKGEPISKDTISRMASFARHLQYKDVPYSEGCGGLMVDAWGGQAGIEWAQTKLKELNMSQNFKAQRRVIFNEDFDETTVADYIEKGFKVHIRSSRKIQKRDRKVWNKLRAVGLTEDVMVFGEVKDLDKKYDYDLLMTGQDPILERLKLMGEDGSKYKILSSKRVDSIQEAFAAETELMKDVNLKFIRVVTRYTYEEIAGIPAAKKYGSRPFCSQLRSTPNKMYSLEEIDSLSTRHLTDMGLPADVLQYRGGFYRNPDSGVTTAGCRHFWRVNVVVEA
jgi:hypothetical protein